MFAHSSMVKVSCTNPPNNDRSDGAQGGAARRPQLENFGSHTSAGDAADRSQWPRCRLIGSIQNSNWTWWGAGDRVLSWLNIGNKASSNMAIWLS